MSPTIRLPLLVVTILFSFFAASVRGEEEVSWPGIEYAFARAYLYGGETHVLREIVRDGNLSSSIEQVQRLADAQVTALLATIQPPPLPKLEGGRMEVRAAMCFDPHHAIVFFDKFCRPVAWMNICFTCGNYRLNPPMPSGRILNLTALEALFRELKIPIGKDAAYHAYLEKANSTVADDSHEFFDLWGYPPKEGDSALPDSEAHWPWRKVATVKLYEFNLKGRSDSIVHLGKINEDVAVEKQLTDEERKAVWATLTRSDWQPFGDKQQIRITVGGRAMVQTVGHERFPSDYTNGQPRLFRHALVCFDAAARPVAWSNLSFSDGRYTSNPTEGSEQNFSPVWHLDKLAPIFKAAGMPSKASEEYMKLEEDALQHQ